MRLAAQCTDERVNQITPALFKRFPTLESFAEADVGEVEEYVHSCGYFRAKARDIVACANVLLEKYGGDCRAPWRSSRRCPAWAEKAANLILGDVFKIARWWTPTVYAYQPSGAGGRSERPGEDRDGAEKAPAAGAFLRIFATASCSTAEPCATRESRCASIAPVQFYSG